MLAALGLTCCCSRRQVVAPAEPAAEPLTATAAAAAAEQRILKPKCEPVAQLASRSLLEASSRRLTVAAQCSVSAAVDGSSSSSEVPLQFLQLYMAAIRDGNAK